MKINVAIKGVVSIVVIVLGGLLKNQHLYGQTSLEKLNKYFSVQNEKEPLSGVVLIQRQGKTIYERAFGYASVEQSVRNSPLTKFPIGSITKPFIATSILLLDQKHLLSVTDKAKKYIPEVPDSWQDISIEHLLSHTSGVGDYLSQPVYDTLKHVETTNAELLKKIISFPLHGKPGDEYEYSNSNYVLLTCIIERITGLDISSFIQKEICRPLGLKNTFFPDSRIPLKALATGYLWQEKLYKADHVNFSNLSGAGGIISTVGDLTTFINGIMKFKILPKPVVEKMITPVKDDYGLGCTNLSYHDRHLIGHPGRIDGYSAHMWYEPKGEFSVVYLSNVNNGPSFAFITNIFDILLNTSVTPNYYVYEEFPPLFPSKVSDRSSDEYTGTYLFRNDILKVTKVGTKLYIESESEKGKIEMMPYNEFKFWVGGPARIIVTFIRDKLAKKVTKAEIVLNGNMTIAEKK